MALARNLRVGDVWQHNGQGPFRYQKGNWKLVKHEHGQWVGVNTEDEDELPQQLDLTLGMTDHDDPEFKLQLIDDQQNWTAADVGPPKTK